MKKLIAFFIGIAAFVSVVACNDAQSQTNLTLDAFINKYKLTKNAQLVDVRTPAEWASGKLASSHLINLSDPSFDTKINQLDKSKPVFVFCAVGGRSGAAVQRFKQAGFKEVYNLQGAGYNALASKGLK